MLIIGIGEAGKLVAKIATERQISRVAIASRTMTKASNIAKMLNVIHVSSDNLVAEMINTDVVVTCAGAPHWILNFHQVEEVMKSRPELPLVIIDIAVPRNVEPKVGQIQNVFLYNIDDLVKVSNLNRIQREKEIYQAEKIIKNEMDKFMSWWQLLEVRPTVSALMKKADEIRLAQLKNTLKKFPSLSEEQYESLEAMTKSIVAKILKDPVHYLKVNGNSKDVDLIRELFRLNEDIQP